MVARQNQITEKRNAVLYITEGIHGITNNTANMFGGTTLTKRYADMLKPVKEETRTEEEVRRDIEEKLRAI